MQTQIILIVKKQSDPVKMFAILTSSLNTNILFENRKRKVLKILEYLLYLVEIATVIRETYVALMGVP